MVRPAKFEINQRSSGPRLIISVSGELDMNTVEVLAQHLNDQLGTNVTLVTLDLRDLAFMDSSGLRLLIDLHDRSRREPWELTLMTPTHEAAAVVLRATGADKALPFEEDHAS